MKCFTTKLNDGRWVVCDGFGDVFGIGDCQYEAIVDANKNGVPLLDIEEVVSNLGDD